MLRTCFSDFSPCDRHRGLGIILPGLIYTEDPVLHSRLLICKQRRDVRRLKAVRLRPDVMLIR